MSKGGPHDLGEVSHRNVVPFSSDGIRSNHASVAPAQKEREAVLTDMVCPPSGSIAGALLATNLEKIKKSGVTVHAPCRAVSAFHVPDDFLAWFSESPLLTSAFIRICSEVEVSTR